MAVDVAKKLFNQTEFAKACDVSISTIRNWVSSSVIKPAHSVGGRDFFTEEQITAVQLLSLRKSITQSFIGLIFEDTDNAFESEKTNFVSKVKATCPSVHSISSLADSMKAMGVGANFELTQSTIPVFRSMVIDKFLLSVRGMVHDVISAIYFEEPLARTFSYQFFLDVLCETEDHKADADLVSAYNSCGITNVKYILPSICSSVITKFNGLKSKFGIYNCCESCGFVLRDCFYSDGKMLLNSPVPIIYDSNAPSAKTVFDSLAKATKNNLIKGGITAVCKEGFYTAIQVKSDTSMNELADIVSIINSGDYKSVYVNSRDKASEFLLSLIDNEVESNKIQWFA